MSLPAYNYFLTSADFSQNPELSLKEKTALVIKDTQSILLKPKGTKPPAQLYNDLFHIILWRELPKTNIIDNTEETLFQKTCEQIIQYHPLFIDFYVKDAETLANSSLETFIQRICFLKKHYSINPVFCDETTEAMKLWEDLSENSFKNILLRYERNKNAYNNLLKFLENLYVTIKKTPLNKQEPGFVHYYFEWQKGTMLVKEILTNLGNMSKRTFYQYVNEFEAHPYYSEYCKLYIVDLIDKEKKGPLDIDWQSYYDEVLPIFKDKEMVTYDYEEYLTLPGYNDNPDKTFHFSLKKKVNTDAFMELAIPLSAIQEKYNLPSTLDVYRTWLTAKKKLKIKD